MFRTLSRYLLPNPLDRKILKMKKQGGRKVLLGWNRGLGDIALGLYAIVFRIRELVPEAEITFLIRKNLEEGFSLLEGVRTLCAPDWKRGEKVSLSKTLQQMGVAEQTFDLIIENPSPTDWVCWQRGKLVPRLRWNQNDEELHRRFDLPEQGTFIGVQIASETSYAPWRNWPLQRWMELFALLGKIKDVKIILFGHAPEPAFSMPHIIDLRGKTTLFAMLSMIRHRCAALVLPDSGILSMAYYLDVSFPIHLISLWADPNHGILKQGVFSPNPLLRHTPLIGSHKDLSSISALHVIRALFPEKPCSFVPSIASIAHPKQESCLFPSDSTFRAAVILLAGGQGSRLGSEAPKGCFVIDGKSLFERLLEKIPKHMPVAVMSSPVNHEATVRFFAARRFFDRDIHFFQQGMLALKNPARRSLKQKAPDGNGSVFSSFTQSGLCSFFKAQGIDTLSIIPVENVLANGADLCFLSYLHTRGADVLVRCIERKEGDPPMGALVERRGRLEIMEYTETASSCFYPYSYTGMMACTMAFMEKMGNVDLPIHWVWKQFGSRWAWKGERFIFDALPYAERPEALCYPKEQVYAPLKSREDLARVLQAVRG